MSDVPRFVSGGTHRAELGRDFPPHQHTNWELVYYREGRVRCLIGDEAVDATPGVLVATRPNTSHAEVAVTGYANNFLLVEAPVDYPWPQMAFDDAESSLARLTSALLRESRGTEPDSARLTDLLMTELDLLLRRAAAAEPPSAAERVVAQAERLIEERFTTGVRISDVAHEVGVSTSHLRSLFVTLRGRTPRDHLRAIRLGNALTHLRHSTVTLETIAELTGFASSSHLSRTVKAATGVTPGQLRGGRV